ncbi:hypothetical protein DO97_16860 [Neosynechococcus sphagnicola sy1]|uniref:Esterase n=1 Tax=Neosynechococcus sphagnicola sy1 TaxID=1497020 RepID=A0A098TN12_9CYAN|nr:hypothetical protein DO97_16860 [Neosynechococcus sphagnicola sy1]
MLYGSAVLTTVMSACTSIQARSPSPNSSVVSSESGSTVDSGVMVLSDLSVNGVTHNYYLYTPTSYNPNNPTPLVLVFHGAGGRGDRMALKTGMNQVANREGFIVAYPNASGEFWVGQEGTPVRSEVIFISALLDTLMQTKHVDPNRIYAAGTSNGGFLTQFLACNMSDKIAAFAAISATLPVALQQSCNPPRAVPIMMIGGTEDQLVPWQGGRSRGQGISILSMPETVDFWRAKNTCTSQVLAKNLPDVNLNDGTQVVRSEYQGCRNASEVVLYKIEGGGHGWPGDTLRQQENRLTGKVSKDINGSEEVWKFFHQYQLR